MNIYSGYGEVYIGDYGGGNEVLLGETRDFAITHSPTVLTRTDSRGGPVYAAQAAVVEQAESIGFTAFDLGADAMSKWFGGSIGLPQTTSSPATSPGPHLVGKWFQFADPPMKVTVSGVSYQFEGSPVEGTHYELDRERGRIRCLIGGNGAVTVNYSSTAVPFGIIQAGQHQLCSLRLLGENRGCGGFGWDIYVAKCVLTAAGNLTLKSDNWSSLPFTATVLDQSLIISARDTI